MWRLDTALVWRDWMTFWHKKITYEVCPEEPGCAPGEHWDENEWACVPDPCPSSDPFYECNCECTSGQKCEWWVCVDIDDGCEYPYIKDPNTGDCVSDDDPIPTPIGWCWPCRKQDPEDPSKCVWDYDECPSPIPSVCTKCIDDDTWECVECPKPGDEVYKQPDVTPTRTYCDDYTIYWSWWAVTQEWKITWANQQSSTISWIRFRYSTDCYSKVECYFRITKQWTFPNKSLVQFWHTRVIPSWRNYSQHIRAYDLEKATWNYDNVFKLTIYADWRQVTYKKEFIREWVWTDWTLFDNSIPPETPPANEIKWMMVGVEWCAEIWDIKVTLIDWEIVITDPTAEPTVYPQQATATYNNKAYWTVAWRMWNVDIVWKTPIFLYNARADTDGKWKEWDTIDWCTYNDWVLTIPRYDNRDKSKFKYVGRWRLPDPYWIEYNQWMFDMKFRFKDYDSDYWLMYIRPWAIAQWWQNPMYFWAEEIDLEGLVWKECRMQIESYCNQSWQYNSYWKLFVWENDVWRVVHNFVTPVFEIQYSSLWFRPYIEIELASRSDPEAIEVHYAMEWTAYWR